MENKQKWHKMMFLSLIFILLAGLFLKPVGIISVQANSEEQEDSGGFIITTEKVDGALNLLGALVGQIDIWDGEIHGLTIVKTLDRGEGREPLVIKITSPGPVPVKDLHAKTVGGEMPGIGGLCAPGQLGWICLEDVSMEVTEQTVKNITLPNAKVETCYESECDDLPEVQSMDQAEMKEKLKKLEEQQKTAENMNEKIEADQDNLKTIQELLNQATEAYESLDKEDYNAKINDLLETFTSGLESEDPNQDDLVSLSENIAGKYDSFKGATKSFIKTVDEADQLIQELDESIKQKEESLGEIETNTDDLEADELEQARIYATLQEMAEAEDDEQNAETEDDKETKKEKSTEPDDSKKEAPESDKATKQLTEEVDMAALKESVKKLRSEWKNVNDIADDIKEKANTTGKQIETITTSIVDIEAAVKELEDDYPIEIIMSIMENLAVITGNITGVEDSKNEDNGDNERDKNDTNNKSQANGAEEPADKDKTKTANDSEEDQKPAKDNAKQSDDANNDNSADKDDKTDPTEDESTSDNQNDEENDDDDKGSGSLIGDILDPIFGIFR